MKGFVSVNESNGVAGIEISIVFSGCICPLSIGLMFSCNAGLFRPAAPLPLRMLPHSGTNVVCTGVMLPKELCAPPQKAREPSRGDVGRSFCVFGAMSGLRDRAGGGEGEEVDARVAAETAGNGAGGGRTGVSARPRPSRSAFFNASISWRRATFSFFMLPNSERIASMSLSRSAISPSSVEMYSIIHRHEVSHQTLLRSRA